MCNRSRVPIHCFIHQFLWLSPSLRVTALCKSPVALPRRNNSRFLAQSHRPPSYAPHWRCRRLSSGSALSQPCRQHFSSENASPSWLGISTFLPCQSCVYRTSPETMRPACTAHSLSGWLAAFSPPRLLIASSPRLLRVAKPLLDFLHCRLVTCVLADVITDLNSVTARSRRNLDDNIEGYRLVPCRFFDVIVYQCQLGLFDWSVYYSLVRKVPTPNVAWNPSASAAFLYLKHRSRLSESEKTIVFFSLMPSWS